MKTIVSTENEWLDQAAEQVRRVLQDKPDTVIALSAEDDCLRLYDALAEDCARSELSFSKAHFFAVTEFEGLSESASESCRSRLSAFLRKIDAPEDACVFLSETNWSDYDALIASAGGLDLAILGLGVNARIGFNEPATPFDSRTHRQKLTPATHRELAGLFGGEELVPAYGLTMGIKTLVEAKEILLVASGEERAKAVFDMLYGRDDSVVPAAFLQIPLNVTLCLDEKAAAKL